MADIVIPEPTQHPLFTSPEWNKLELEVARKLFPGRHVEVKGHAYFRLADGQSQRILCWETFWEWAVLTEC